MKGTPHGTLKFHMVRFATVKELRQDTARLLAEIGTGERFVITRRGKPVAVLAPFTPPQEPRQPVRPFAEAWEEIESVLRDSDPAFATLEEAMGRFRQRPTLK